MFATTIAVKINVIDVVKKLVKKNAIAIAVVKRIMIHVVREITITSVNVIIVAKEDGV